MRKKSYTVVLVRPDYITDEFGRDVYVAHVHARDEYHAIKVAQREVFRADKKDKMEPNAPEDYALTVLFEGIQEVSLWHFSAGVNR